MSAAFPQIAVVAGQVAFEPMWFELGLCQHPLHGRLTQPQRLGQFSARSVRTAVDWLLLSASKNANLHGRCGRARLTAFVLPLQAGHAGLFKPSLPLRDRGCTRVQCPLNLSITSPSDKERFNCAPNISPAGNARDRAHCSNSSLSVPN